MSQWIEVTGATLALLGLALLARAFAGVVAEREEARVVAMQLALVVRHLEVLPVVEHRMEESAGVIATGTTAEPMPAGAVRGRPFTVVPVPVSVAVIGRSPQLDRWSLQVAKILRRHDLMAGVER